MGGNGQPPKAQSMVGVMGDLYNYLPGLLQQMSGQLPAVASMGALSSAAQQPILNASNLANVNAFGVPLAQAGQQVAASNTGSVAGLNQQYNPSYALANQIGSNINLSGLSPGESNAVERSLNQTNTATGNLGLINPLNTVSNAMNFGGMYNNKLGIAANALSPMTSASVGSGVPAAASGNTFGTGQFVQANPSTSQIPSSSVFGFGSSLLGNQTSFNNTALSGQVSQANQNSIPSYLNATLGNL